MTISVALCTYNGEAFLNQQIDSILNQTLKVNEIIVCDDGSIDSTISILEKYSIGNPNLFKIYFNEVNLRSVRNFEKAIGLCSGEIIFLSDQDDVWVENKVEKYIDHFNKNPNIEVIASNGFCIDENNNVHEKYAIWDVPSFLKEQKIEFEYFKIISYIANIATGASIAIRSKIIKEIIPFPLVNDFHHDEWIALVSTYKNSFEMLNEKYFYYRIHNNQQVGGVFFEKTNKTKLLLTDLFNFENNYNSLVTYKKRLKKLCYSYAKNKKLITTNNPNQKFTEIFTEICDDIEKLFLKTKSNFKTSHPILYLFISTTDKILKKRELK
jgi:glycosyltransferase involved in cell wall biosynthesis